MSMLDEDIDKFRKVTKMILIFLGDQARGFFLQSGLPTAVLGQIW